jgi:hydroxymethylbilane synthase
LLTIGSRGSKLALWQAHHVQSLLASRGYECRIEIIKTSGDARTDVPMKQIGNKGIFTKEIEDALLDFRIDVAVHSLKDMPTALPHGLQITATPEREDARDVLIGLRLNQLTAGARVGTGSLRRIAQLLALRPDLRVLPIRGNVDTRIRKLDEGEFDAIVLAAAGMNRLGFSARIAEILPVDVMCPAVGQGALAIETRSDQGLATMACQDLDNADTRAAITAERAVLAQLGGGCEVPIGAHAMVKAGEVRLRAIVISPDGTRLIKDEMVGSAAHAEALGAAMARRLIEQGAQEVLSAVYGPAK